MATSAARTLRPPALRPRGADDLGLRRALSDRLLPLLVAAVVFLAALAGAGSLAASGLAAHWRGGAGGAVTVQVPEPSQIGPATLTNGTTRADQAASLLGPAARRLSDSELAALLRPWLGDETEHLSVVMPAVFVLPASLPPAVQSRLTRAVPGVLIAQDSVWQDRLAALAASLQACANVALLVVAFVAAAVVAVSTRAGLAARRDSIEIVHGLGAADGRIAGRFAARVTLLVVAGAGLGALLAVPVLLSLARLTAPFQPAPTLVPWPATPALTSLGPLLATLPPTLWGLLGSLPLLAGAIAWITTQATVRSWLARLP
jgi:cell division transport system permease protein